MSNKNQAIHITTRLLDAVPRAGKLPMGDDELAKVLHDAHTEIYRLQEQIKIRRIVQGLNEIAAHLYDESITIAGVTYGEIIHDAIEFIEDHIDYRSDYPAAAPPTPPRSSPPPF